MTVALGLRKEGRQPGFRLSAESRARIGASVRASVAASTRWRPPPGREAEYLALRSEVGAAEAKRMIDADAAHRRITEHPLNANHVERDGG